MSKLSDAINYTLTRDIKAARSLDLKYTTVTVDMAEVAPLTYNTAKKFVLGVKLYTEAWIRDDYVIKEALKDVKRAMIEEIFGEFRPLIADLRVATWNDDTMRVRELLNELEEKMFF
jgi:hypothetical protein